ncbi:hypothetical protein Tco_0487447 [Tanacetum coccineum]
MKIQARAQVSRLGELRRHLHIWKCFRRLYFVVIVLVRNIKRGDDEEMLTGDELSNLEENNVEKEIAEIFRIETYLFHFNRPLCKAFKDFNYLLQIDVDVLTREDGTWKEPIEDISHVCKSFHFKSRHVKWLTCKWKDEGQCDRGDLPGMIRIGNMTYFQDYKWYEGLEYGELKDDALKQKLMTMLQKYWWGIKEEKSNDDAWSYYSPITDSTGAGTINDDTIQTNQRYLGEQEHMDDDNDDIKDLDDYITTQEFSSNAKPILLLSQLYGEIFRFITLLALSISQYVM